MTRTLLGMLLLGTMTACGPALLSGTSTTPAATGATATPGISLAPGSGGQIPASLLGQLQQIAQQQQQAANANANPYTSNMDPTLTPTTQPTPAPQPSPSP